MKASRSKSARKIPGAAQHLESVDMGFTYANAFGIQSPEAYERLIADCMLGDSTLFIRRDEIEASWRIIDSITSEWAKLPPETSILIQQAPGDHQRPRPLLRMTGANGIILLNRTFLLNACVCETQAFTIYSEKARATIKSCRPRFFLSRFPIFSGYPWDQFCQD